MKLGEVIRDWRAMQRRSQRDVAAEIGIGFSTLCRIENDQVMDGETLAKILAWLTQAS